MSLRALDTRPSTIVNDVFNTRLQFCFDKMCPCTTSVPFETELYATMNWKYIIFFYFRNHSLIFSTLALFARFSKQYWDCLNHRETKSYSEYTSQYEMIIYHELNDIVSIAVTSSGLCD